MSRYHDLTDKVFNDLTVLRLDSITEDRRVRWLCQCLCGNETVVYASALRTGSTKRCKECGVKLVTKKITDDLSGHIFGELTVVKQTQGRNDGKAYWLCLCSCGAEVIANSSSLKHGGTKQCKACRYLNAAKTKTTHGLSKLPAYRKIQKLVRNERTRHIDTEWTVDMENAIRQFHSVCVICGSDDRLCVDHVLPLSKGYGLIPGNAVILCRSHNSRKHNIDIEKLPEDWQTKILEAAESFRLYWEENHT